MGFFDDLLPSPTDSEEVAVGPWLVNRRTKARRRNPDYQGPLVAGAEDTSVQPEGSFLGGLYDRAPDVAKGVVSSLPTAAAQGIGAASYLEKMARQLPVVAGPLAPALAFSRPSPELEEAKSSLADQLRGAGEELRAKPVRFRDKPIRASANAIAENALPGLLSTMAGGPLGASAWFASTGASETQRNLVERGVDPAKADALAAPVGLIQGALGAFGIGSAPAVGAASTSLARALASAGARGAVQNVGGEAAAIAAEKLGGALTTSEDPGILERLALAATTGAAPAALLAAAHRQPGARPAAADTFAERFVNPETTVRDRVAARLESPERRARTQKDALTGLENQNSWQQPILDADGLDTGKYTGMRARAEADPTVDIHFIDADGLKNVNDTFGMPVGDALVLKPIADAIRRTNAALGLSDRTSARIGGDEFGVIVPKELSAAYLERIRAEIPKQILRAPDGKSFMFTDAEAAFADAQEDAKHKVVTAKKDKPARGVLLNEEEAGVLAALHGIKPATPEELFAARRRGVTEKVEEAIGKNDPAKAAEYLASLGELEDPGLRTVSGLLTGSEPPPLTADERVALDWAQRITQESETVARPGESPAQRRQREHEAALDALDVMRLTLDDPNPPDPPGQPPVPPSGGVPGNPFDPPPTAPRGPVPPAQPPGGAVPPGVQPPPGAQPPGARPPGAPPPAQPPGAQPPPGGAAPNPARPNWLQRNFTPRHGIPADIYNVLSEARQFRRALEMQGNFAATDLSRAVARAASSSEERTRLLELSWRAAQGQVEMSALPPELVAPVTAARETVDTVTQMLIDRGLGDAGTYEQNLGTYWYKAYEAHNNPRWLETVRNTALWGEARAEIAHQLLETGRAASPEEATRRAGGVLEVMMTPPEIGHATAADGLRGIADEWMARRQNFSPAMRAVLGEIREPVTGMARMISYAAETMARHDMWQGLQAFVGRDFFLMPEEGASAPLPGAPREMFATRELRTAMDAAFRVAASSSPLNRWIKKAVTTYNLTGHIRNVPSGFMAVVANGNVIPGLTTDASAGIRAALAANFSSDNNARALAIEATRYGVTHTNVHLGALREYATPSPNRAIAAIDRVVERAYGAEDEAFKVWAYAAEKRRAAWALGLPETSHEVRAYAAEVVKSTFSNYDRMPGYAQEIQKARYIGPFVGWAATTLQAAIGTASVAGREVRDGMRMGNKRLAASGAYRMASLAGTLAAPGIAAAAAPAVLRVFRESEGETWSDEHDKAWRELAPDWAKQTTIVPIRSGGGVATVLDGGYVNYHGVISETAWAAFRGEDAKEAATNAAIQLANRFLAPELAVAAAMDMLDQVRAEQSIPLKFLRATEVALRYGVGTVRKAVSVYRAPDKERAWVEATAALTGMRPITIDVDQSVKVHSYQWREQADRAFSELGQAALRRTPNAGQAVAIYKSSVMDELTGIYTKAHAIKRGVDLFGGTQSAYENAIAGVGKGGEVALAGGDPQLAAKVTYADWYDQFRDAVARKADDELALWKRRNPTAPANRVNEVKRELEAWKTSTLQTLAP